MKQFLSYYCPLVVIWRDREESESRYEESKGKKGAKGWGNVT